ncbi:hypothetical protein [Halorubrum sp. AJ67]|uniref:hypothetical protein n=1 Tax=Halorubrum sp. AJ67 TaxID=1173487 RepID=UPI0003DC6316|nr:hypothetical protein [Halorubrum sp. AJ67]CDK38099.1 hypothetical protein BN903_299 [Halorubrum sp. AJ67]
MASSAFESLTASLDDQPTYAATLADILDAIVDRETVIWTDVNETFPDGTECLGAGAGRLVVALPLLPDTTVAKLAIPQWGTGFTSGTLQNALEHHISTTPTALSTVTLPCLATPEDGYRWGVYPRAAPENETTAAGPTIQRAWQELDELGFTTSDIFAHENWGVYRGQSYLIDYGYAHPDDDCRLATTIAPQCEQWRAERAAQSE